MDIKELKERVLQGGEITRLEAEWLIESADAEELYSAASEISRAMASRRFDMCSIINARSGSCSEDCHWCAQSAHYSTGVECYDLVAKARCLSEAKYNEEQGIGSFSLVTSGHSCSGEELDGLCSTLSYIKERSNIALCASLGLLGAEELRKIKEHGVTRYHCNIETAPSYFEELCTTHTMEDKFATLRAAHKAGLKLCSGGIIGMGESAKQRVEFGFALRGIGVDSIPINILQPIKGTPLEGARPISDQEVLRTVATLRFIHPEAWLRFAGGRAQLGEDTLRRALEIGVNSAIVGDLLTTIGSTVSEDKKIIEEVGYEL